MDGQGGLHLRLVLVGDQGGLNSALSGPIVVTLWRGFFLPVFAYTRVEATAPVCPSVCNASSYPGERVAPIASNRLRTVFLWPLGTRSPLLQELLTTNDRL